MSKLVQLCDYRTGRFDAFVVRSEDDRRACVRLLDRVRGEELGRIYGRSALDSAAFASEKVEDTLLACRDTRTGMIIGCVRSTPADQVAHLAASQQEYHLDRIPRELLARTVIGTRFAVQRDYRHSVASLVLKEKAYRETMRLGYALSLMTCEPGLFNYYTALGYRPMGRVHAGFTCGFRITMAMVHHDREHLERVRSPLVKVLRSHRGPLDEEALRWWADYERRHDTVNIGLARYVQTDSAIHGALSEGMSPKGVAELLHHAYLVDCLPRHLIIAKGDGGRSLFIVERGRVAVESGGRVVATFAAGEVFGELALILRGARTADVRAAGAGTRVLVLSQSALQRVSQAADQAALWRNLARVSGAAAAGAHLHPYSSPTPAEGVSSPATGLPVGSQ
ncbi:cyclic nucleotide-binding domain-containing protein [Mycobacterium lacus]|uniref:cyclic nucleotide-binding domain-containing protein n=1 Tax=Mycobacterium lacus TaxID=169765 RepID=UPI0013CF73E6|nr:cyclic nucleotide-binding domain-containing protein [Mycobacterium lacus]MCV7125781.1 cyclic nucleotide-binding domain-containing protein [Mycobacterium lacus]